MLPKFIYRISGVMGTVLLSLALGLSQTAFAGGGGLVTDDEASLSSVTRTEPY